MIIPNVEMPRSCSECMMNCCPLKKLSTPHGRLIDADKLADDLEWDANRAREMLDGLDPLTAEYVQLRDERDIKSNAAWWIRNDADKNCLVPAEE